MKTGALLLLIIFCVCGLGGCGKTEKDSLGVTPTKSIVTTPTTWAWEKGEELGNGSAKYVFAPVTAIVSAPFAGIYFIGDAVADVFKKGKDFTINKGETIQVQLLKPLDMPVY